MSPTVDVQTSHRTSYNAMLLSRKVERAVDAWINTKESQKQEGEGKKPDTKEYTIQNFLAKEKPTEAESRSVVVWSWGWRGN